ncbi:MAG: histidine phosphatase family protein [Enhydrobacter sp.]|nr:histidine phosphatase family protein [Enhydrobacter sp.]
MAVPFAIVRHAPTSWNAEGRLQGSTDVPLSPAGDTRARNWLLPAPADRWRRMCSPLQRARRTAELMQPTVPVTVDSRLREMSFGVWEGKSVAQLRAEGGETFAAAERLGLDFHPPGGESPRLVMDRIAGWARDIAIADQPAVAISHKAAIRALLVLATGWDMTGRMPVKLDWTCLHFFTAHANGAVTLDRPNVPLS